MEIRSETFQLGNDTYVIAMLDPTVAALLGTKLLKALSPVLGPLFESASGSGDDLKALLASSINDPKIVDAIQQLFGALDQALIEETITTLRKVTTVNNTPLDQIYAVHFRGRVLDLVKWWGLALRAQYADFSDALDTATGQGAL